jgi:hypothetical protein
MDTFPFEWLPTDPPRVAPSLMTAQEAVVYLRLDEGGRDMADALKSLEYLVQTGRVRPCRVGRHNRFARAELHRFVIDQTERYGKTKANPMDPANGAA